MEHIVNPQLMKTAAAILERIRLSESLREPGDQKALEHAQKELDYFALSVGLSTEALTRLVKAWKKAQ